MTKPKSKASTPTRVYDVGSAFTKVGDFEHESGKAVQVGWQFLPSGVRLETPPDKSSLLTTSRLVMIQVLVAGIVNEHIEESLQFCQQLGLPVAGVLSHKQLVWEGEEEEAAAPFDAVLLMGGFERKSKKQLTQLVSRLRQILERNAGPVTIFYLGSAELRSVVESILEADFPVHFIPDTWPGKTHRDFLRLFVELQALQLRRAVSDDPQLAAYCEAGIPMISGHAALLSSLALLTRAWESNTLVIDIGSDKTTACWSYYSDTFSMPEWNPSIQTSMFSGMGGEHDQSHFGVKIYPRYGLGGNVDEAFAEMKLEDSALLWPVEDGLKFRDRVLNHSLYSSTVPDRTDIQWQSALVQHFLKQIWADLPSDFYPRHVVFSGAYFGRGERLNAFLDRALFPSHFPYTATLWCNQTPMLPALGLLAGRVETIDPNMALFRLGEYVLLRGKPDRKGVLAHVEVSGANGLAKKFDVKRGERHVLAVSAQQQAVVRFDPTAKVQVREEKRGAAMEIEVGDPLEKGIMIDGRIN